MDTVIFHFDPLTGEDIKSVTLTDGETKNPRTDGKWISVLEGVDVIAGPLVDAFLLPDGKDTIGMLDEFLQVSSTLPVTLRLTVRIRSNFTLIPPPRAPPLHR